MFEAIEVAQPSHKGTTALAFGINASVVLLAIALPLFRPDQLPNVRILSSPGVPYNAPSQPHADVVPVGTTHEQNFIADARFVYPGHFRPHPSTEPDDPAPSGPFNPGFTGLHGTATSNGSGFPWGDSLNPPPVAPSPAPTPRPTIVNVSHLDPGALIYRVQPEYPAAAKAVRQQGTIVLSARIDTTGRIVGLQAISGPPLLVRAAMEAVKQWRYRPYMLNGSAVEVRTEVIVNFVLQ